MATNGLEIPIALVVVPGPVCMVWGALAYGQKRQPAAKSTQVKGNSRNATYN